MYDLIVVGGGPAAIAGGVYAARKQLSTLLIAKEFGGQSVVSPEIQNWIGTRSISGIDLARSLKEHLYAYVGVGVTVAEGVLAEQITMEREGEFHVHTDDGKVYKAATVLLATGARRRTLTVPGAATFEHKGLTYCATCDGPLFSGMDVAVIGSGNAGFETAAQLLAYAKSVTLLERTATFRADPVTVTKVLSHPQMRALTNVDTVEVTGDRMVTGLTYRDGTSDTLHTLGVQGIFVEIGVTPNSDMVADLVERDVQGHIVVDPRTQRTSRLGIWAAGDCTDGLYAQNNIAVGDAVKAIENLYQHLRFR